MHYQYSIIHPENNDLNAQADVNVLVKSTYMKLNIKWPSMCVSGYVELALIKIFLITSNVKMILFCFTRLPFLQTVVL